MNVTNQPVSPAKKPVSWIIIAVVGALICICVLAVGLVAGLGIGGKLPLAMLSTPTPAFTLTFTPTIAASPLPTDTPAPLPTVTLAAVPTQSLSSIIEVLQPAAQGNGVSEAAAYDQSKPGIHPIVIVAPSKDQDEWNSSLPVSWLPSNVSQAELVALVTYNEVEIERAHYFGKGINVWVSRIRIDTTVIIREAQTGQTVSSYVFEGSEPPSLPKRLSVGTTALYGTSVAYETVQIWLKTYVEP
jgi:hypothetical protein